MFNIPWFVYIVVAFAIIALVTYLKKRRIIKPEDLMDVKKIIALIIPMIRDVELKAALQIVLEYLRVLTGETEASDKARQILATSKVPENVRPLLAKLAEKCAK